MVERTLIQKANAKRVENLLSIERYQIYEHRAFEPQYQELVKKANRRLSSLEKLSQEKYFHGVNKFAAQSLRYEANLYNYLTEGGKISQRVPGSEAERNRRVKALQKFLTSPTSIKSGLIEINQKRADTINKRYGTNFTWQDIAKYFESGIAEKNDNNYSSKTALNAIGEIQKQADVVKKQIEQHKQKTIIAEDSEIQWVVDELLVNKGLTRLGLY